MKAFVVAALLVASVAGQSLDMYKPTRNGLIFNKDRQLKNYPAFGGDYSNMIDVDSYYPSTYNYGDDYYLNVLQYDEIVAQPLFREYMRLPLFRQYWSYPMFQRYVCSQYFQRYWTLPAFQQYFYNPALFYKYVYPIVQLFKDDSTTYNSYTGGEWIWNRNYPTENYFQGQQQQFNYGVPTVCRYNAARYCQALFQNIYNHLMYTTQMTAPIDTTSTSDYYRYNPYYARMMYPTVYNKEFQNFEVPSKTVMNEDFLRPVLANTIGRDATIINKPLIADKAFEQTKVVPEQVIKV